MSWLLYILHAYLRDLLSDHIALVKFSGINKSKRRSVSALAIFYFDCCFDLLSLGGQKWFMKVINGRVVLFVSSTSHKVLVTDK